MFLRRDYESCIGAATRVPRGSDNVELAEVLGLKEAINYVECRREKWVIFDMDAEAIVRAISCRSFPRS
ncbi:hypothetical protein A2U01_0051852 [Trifolium medium]|uniref:RNase H type-1 domain-containing protein n=1 Tax=Trifolium medium TaxID=97028 RepID=A0A392R248_9FABA|nr:hypothetical protein [Trifolium medium]